MVKKYLEGTRIEDLTGMKFGRLTVVGFDWDRYERDKIRKKNGDIRDIHTYWICRCDCGNMLSVCGSNLKNKEHTSSCGCKSIEMAKIRNSKVKTMSFEQWCLDNNHQDYLDLWDYDLNDKKPSEVGFGSGKKYWFKCSKGTHSSELWTIGTITKDDVIVNCRSCNSFGQYLMNYKMDISKVWSIKNDRSPFDISCGSGRRVYLMCEKCGIEYKTTPNGYTGKKTGCPVCSGKKVVKGINDIATTHPHLVRCFANKEDSHIHSYGSNKKVDVVCDTCGDIRKMSIYHLATDGFSCNLCNDGISYPNKFITELLKQRLINFDVERRFEWSQNKVYDHYLKSLGIIIENHGRQHYCEHGFSHIGGRTLEEEQANDKLKRELALSNGIKHYIELDCRKSDMEWIKQSIMSSELPELLKFKEEDIDWKKCSLFKRNSRLVEACNMWNEEKSTVNIGKKLGINRSVVLMYLKRGVELGICSYEANDVKTKFKQKQVEMFKNGDSIGVFESRTLLEDMSVSLFGVKLEKSSVSLVCLSKIPSYKGFTFKYID